MSCEYRQQVKDVVVLSAIDWQFIWQRYQIISKLFAESGFNVFYVESTAKRNPGLRDVPRVIKRLLNRGNRPVSGENPVPENLTVISPIMLPSTWKIFRIINRLFLIGNFVKKLDGMGVSKPFVYCYLPTQTSLDIIEELDPLLVIYDCVDNFAAFPGVPRDFLEIERKLIERADTMFVTSDYLYKEKKKYRSDIKQVLPAVDFALFNSADRGQLKKVETLCYFGVVCERLDYDLIKKIAESFKSIRIKMVGPVIGKLPPLPDNVLFVGRKKYCDLPEELLVADCLIFPYKINNYTKGIIPAKLFESFATGKPIISTALPNFEKFKELILVAQSHEDFLSHIKNLLALETEDKRVKRIDMARANSWEKRFNQIMQYIEEKL